MTYEPLNFTAAVPVLVTVTVWPVPVVPSCTSPKSSAVGDTVMLGVVAAPTAWVPTSAADAQPAMSRATAVMRAAAPT